MGRTPSGRSIADTLRGHATTTPRAGDEAHLHVHRRGAGAGDALASCRSSRRSPRQAGVEIELRDISLAGRILAQFPDRLTDEQRVPDALGELGELAKTPEANIIKLPNISASIPQLKAAIKELQEAGYDVPDYPDDPRTDDAKSAREAYDRVKGSARQPGAARGQLGSPRARVGEGLRRASTRTRWARGRRTTARTWRRCATATSARPSARVTMDADDELRIEYVAADGAATVLKDVDPGARGRGRRRRGDARPRARRVPAGADRRHQGAGPAVLPAPEGDDDEGLGPDHLRARRPRVLRRRLHRAPRRAGEPRREPEQRPRRDPDARSTSCPRTRATRSGPRSRRRSRRRRTSRWWTPTAGSRTCTSRAT